MKRFGCLLALGWGLAVGLLGWPPAGRAQTLPLPLPRLRALQDSLTRLLAHDLRPDTLRVRRLNTLGFALRFNDPAQARALARQALALAQRLHYAPGLMEAHFTLGYDFRARSLYDSAIYHSRQALALAMRTHNPLTQSRAYYNLCRIYSEQGNYAAAIGLSLDGLALVRTLHRPAVEALQLVQAGRVELGLGELPTAQQYLEEARRLLPLAHDSVCTAFVYQGIGDIYRQQGQWQAARQAYARTLRAYRTVHTERGLLPAALLLARTWQPTRPDSARPYAVRSLSIAATHRLLPLARDAIQLLAQVSGQLGAFREAYRYQVQAMAYADTLSGEDTRRRLAAASARAARSRIQMQLHVLQQQQELEHLRSRQQLLLAVGGAAGLLLLAGWLFWQYRRRQQAQRAQAATVLRQRLAADLHDDVGALLTQVSLQADLLRETPATAPAQVEARLRRLSDTSRQAARQMADVVWGLHTASATLPEVLAHMRDHAHEVLPLAGLAVQFTISPEAARAQASVAVCQTLYLLYKEALHNVVKHAHGATQATVTLTCQASQLCLQVGDNAPGPAPSARPGGQGLGNMRRRVEAVGGSLQVQPTAAGFELRACLPATDRAGQ